MPSAIRYRVWGHEFNITEVTKRGIPDGWFAAVHLKPTRFKGDDSAMVYQFPDSESTRQYAARWAAIFPRAPVLKAGEYGHRPARHERAALMSQIAGDIEGGRRLVRQARAERSRRLREAAIRIHGEKCTVCGFDFKERYGDHGAGYIEVHHLRPLSQGVREVDPAKDLTVVCANCHAMMHRRSKEPLPPTALRLLMRKARGAKRL